MRGRLSDKAVALEGLPPVLLSAECPVHDLIATCLLIRRTASPADI